MKAALIAFFSLFILSSKAQWVLGDKAPLPLVTGPAVEFDAAYTWYKDGNTYYAWTDYRSGNGELFAQKLNKFGESEWQNNGIRIGKVVDRLQYVLTKKDLLASKSNRIRLQGTRGLNIAWQSIPNSSMLYERNINLSFRSKAGGEIAIGSSSRDDHVINNSAVQASKEVNDDILRIRLKGNNGIGVIYNSLSEAKDSLFVNQSFIYNGNAFFNEEKVNFVNAGRKGTKILFEADSIDAVILKTDLQN
ncbi:MAG: hypothetical protein ACI97P_002861, partial [Arcticibacterium sp.]